MSGGHGVSRVVVTLNGVEVSRLEEPTPQRALAVNLSLKLREGENILVITAMESDGMIHQEVRTIHYEKRVPLTVDFRYPEDRLRVTDTVPWLTPPSCTRWSVAPPGSPWTRMA